MPHGKPFYLVLRNRANNSPAASSLSLWRNPNYELTLFICKPFSRLVLSIKAEGVLPLVRMEGQSSLTDPMQLVPLDFCGDAAIDVSQATGDDPTNNSLGNACGSELTDFSMDMDDWKVRCLRPVNDELVNAQHQLHAKYHTSRTDNLYGDKKDNVSQVDPRARSALPDFHSQPHRHISTQRAAVTDRSRRMRIAEDLMHCENCFQYPQSLSVKIKSRLYRVDLQTKSCLPPEMGVRIRFNNCHIYENAASDSDVQYHMEGGQSFVVDDVIDHIKFLQLQIKDLCRSRLGGETITEPIIFREGYGHYFCHQKMLNEPLEEMMGKLLETNPMEASQLLENKDLLLLPMDYSEPLA
ncbi:uncharacterized protein Pyn_08843 [Prunus yedoensis var. nudiflora]|uniref:Uncharacterized protein n=1 Tax=Prunus yedoensis var. nudiflora TaxID=2094558 RepID=A0A314ZHY4_PRUYE|nr:uncharacterized protein Pyn_08843 [Prunus yedoensis var. nudiflora]